MLLDDDAVSVQTTSAQQYLHNSDLESTQRERSEVVTGKSELAHSSPFLVPSIEQHPYAGDFFDVTAPNSYDIGYDYT